MVEQELLQAIKQRLAEHYGERLRGVILYGSEARGDAREDSDVDLMVLLEGPVDVGEESDAIIDRLYPLQIKRKFYRPLQVVPVDVDQYEAQSFLLHRHVREEGILL